MGNLVSTKELAETLRVKPGTIRDAVKAGRLHPIRLSRKVMRFNLDEVRLQLQSPSPAAAAH